MIKVTGRNAGDKPEAAVSKSVEDPQQPECRDWARCAPQPQEALTGSARGRGIPPRQQRITRPTDDAERKEAVPGSLPSSEKGLHKFLDDKFKISQRALKREKHS